jgi:Ni,Fe-hydrogenase III large subunit/Ni,Fe-hydrogenase III component G
MSNYPNDPAPGSAAAPLPASDPAGQPAGAHRVALPANAEDLPGQAAQLAGQGYRLALVAGHDDGHQFRAVYLFLNARPDRRVELHLPIDHDTPTVPTLAALSFPAGRFEREMHDLYGITPLGHPQPRRLVRHHHWPRHWYPMRRDAGPAPAFGDTDGPYPFLAVEGPGVYEIPVGPVHAGLIEPGHFRFSVVGETILKLKARLWFVHKGIEQLFHGRSPTDGLPLAERISGDTTVGHALAYSLAVEDATGRPAPPETAPMRAVALELERLYNHVTDLGALCNDVGHAILNAHAQRVREHLLRLNAEVTGHRLLRGAVQPGGATLHRRPDPDRLAALAADAAEIADLALHHSVVHDRFTGTAVLTTQQARDIGVVGYVARASGLHIDARRDHPHCDLPDILGPTDHTSGDVLARFQIRAAEIATSTALITHLARDTPTGHIHNQHQPRPTDRSSGSGVGIIEGWRGTIVHRVETDPDGTLSRVKIVDPSFFNWPALPVALTNTIVPDFPLVNKSFNLSYAGNDL